MVDVQAAVIDLADVRKQILWKKPDREYSVPFEVRRLHIPFRPGKPIELDPAIEAVIRNEGNFIASRPYLLNRIARDPS